MAMTLAIQNVGEEIGMNAFTSEFCLLCESDNNLHKNRKLYRDYDQYVE